MDKKYNGWNDNRTPMYGVGGNEPLLKQNSIIMDNIKLESAPIRHSGSYIILAYLYGYIKGECLLIDLCQGIDHAQQVCFEHSNKLKGKYSFVVMAKNNRTQQFEQVYELPKTIETDDFDYLSDIKNMDDYSKGKIDERVRLMSDDKTILHVFTCMCQESLEPKTYEKYEEVVNELKSVRQSLKSNSEQNPEGSVATDDAQSDGAGKPKKEQSAFPDFLPVLEENYQAQIAGFYNYDKTEEERKIRNAVIEEYQDLIAIYKSRCKSASSPTTEEGVRSKEVGEWQLCPKCSGQGTVSKPPYIPGDVYEWDSSSLSHVCDVCNGAKILAKPIISSGITTPSSEAIQNQNNS